MRTLVGVKQAESGQSWVYIEDAWLWGEGACGKKPGDRAPGGSCWSGSGKWQWGPELRQRWQEWSRDVWEMCWIEVTRGQMTSVFLLGWLASSSSTTKLDRENKSKKENQGQSIKRSADLCMLHGRLPGQLKLSPNYPKMLWQLLLLQGIKDDFLWPPDAFKICMDKMPFVHETIAASSAEIGFAAWHKWHLAIVLLR